jgi:hypothetical protein
MVATAELVVIGRSESIRPSGANLLRVGSAERSGGTDAAPGSAGYRPRQNSVRIARNRQGILLDRKVAPAAQSPKAAA